MDTAMTKEMLKALFDETICDVTKKAAGISLHQGSGKPVGDSCTVYASFERGFHTSVSFFAEEALFKRLTQYMMQAEKVTPKDVEDFTIEYFNMLCGHIASRMFQKTKVASRFGIPVFYRSRYIPGNQGEDFVINYTSDDNENAQFIHHIPKGR